MGKGNPRVEDPDGTSSAVLNECPSDALSDHLIEIDHRVTVGLSVDEVIPTDLSEEDRRELEAATECLQLLSQLREHVADSSTEIKDSEESTESAEKDLSDLLCQGDNSKRFGHFDLKRVLGQGGFGIVYLAFDRILGRDVALKLPRLDRLVVPEFRRRFLQEGRAAAGLNHTNIVAVHEAGELHGVCYLSMTFCDGLTLSAYLSRQLSPLTPKQAACLVADLASGVEHAHQRGILHRDLKPSNILLQLENDSSEVDPGYVDSRFWRREIR
ncbi:MAG: serine/threonine protein kinase [Planctomycetes bacterium]|nr:serine/threonine protein kinase [Planctomycetota bacterium]